MSIYAQLSYDQDIESVRGIQFSVLSPDEIVRRSVVEVTKTDTYSGNVPVVGGLFDPRMGVLEHNRYCDTCHQKNIFCPGHFGHITMAKPVYQAMFFEHTKKVLKCVCHRCSRLLVSPSSTVKDLGEEARRIGNIKNLAKRHDAMVALCGNTRIKCCGDDMDPKEENGRPGCGAMVPTKYVKDGALKIVAEWKDPKDKDAEPVRREYSAEDVLRIFSRITDGDSELMGFTKWNRPEWMICTVLPVPPPAVRPSIIEENGQRREDDLTHKLSDILKVNTQLKQRIERGAVTEEYLRLTTMVLQYHVATFINNQIPGLPQAQQRNGRKLKSISDRLKKKEGRIRGNLNGKRVDQSARSVITPDPYISMDELGVPYKVALQLTFPETVNKYNIEELRQLVRNGPDRWPGAKYVRSTEQGKTFTLRFEASREKIAEELAIGDIVDRHLRDGDYVLFNRQPSLHKMSMMCHRVKVMPFQTFRLNPMDCSPFNADFDGDEMNTHCPQSIQTMSELMDFASVPYMVLTPKDAKPIIEVIQDTSVGAYRLTKAHTRMHEKVFANLQMVNSYFDGVLPRADDEHHTYTGRSAFSGILPPSLFLAVNNKAKEKVIIDNSRLTHGFIDKAVFSEMSRGLLPVIFHDYGPFEVRRFLDNLQRLVCRWLMTAGFSVGISDLAVSDDIQHELKAVITKMKEEAYKRLDDVRRGTFENTSMFDMRDAFEREIISILNDSMKKAGSIGLRTIDDRWNRLINMVKSGSKGKDLNVSQMIAAVGQQNVDGKRVAYGFTDRTLPHYCKYDDGPEARGFVENSFISGLSPQEMFFHAMGGREGLIDTAVKTSETGYIQRRFVKAMEDSKLYYDNTVRNASGTIVQFLYGEDGMEGTHIERQVVPTVQKSLFELDRDYHLRSSDPLHVYLTDDAMEAMKKEGAWTKRADEHFEALLKDRHQLITEVFGCENQSTIYYPIPFERILRNAYERSKAVGVADAPTDLTPTVVLDAVDTLCKELYVAKPDQGVFFAQLLVRCYLSPKPLIMQHRLKKSVFEWVVEEVRRYFREAIAPAGEMVGIIAAQSLGEPLTQLTLDSFHVSGTAAAVKATSGVPRIKELLSVSKNMKTPSLTIYLKKDIGTVVNPAETDAEGIHADTRVREAKERAMQVLRSLETTRLEQVLESTELFYDPPGEDGFGTLIEEDKEFLDVYRQFAALSSQHSTSPWVLRMRIDRAKLHAARLTMTDVYLKLMASNWSIACLFSDDNARNLVMRVSLNDADKQHDDHVASLKALEQTLIHKAIKGVDRIRKVSMHAKSFERYNPTSQAFEKVAEWILDTDGTNLTEILANPNVDSTRTVSNDPREIFAVLGIEAARNSLYNEITEVIKESSVNFRHVSLLIDTMCHRGNLMSIDRHGINRGDVGPLAKSSFEETTDMLVNASVFSEFDRINGVSANIMLGQLPPCGTGDSEILLHEDMYLALLQGMGKKKRRLPAVVEETAEGEGDEGAEGVDDALSAGPAGRTAEMEAASSAACALSAFKFHHKPIVKQNVGNAYRLPEIDF